MLNIQKLHYARHLAAISVAILTMMMVQNIGLSSSTAARILEWNTSQGEARIELNVPWLPFENETRCYAEIGCVAITRDWYHLLYRPINVFPLPRQVINVQFILYTRKNPTLGQILKFHSDKSILKSNFDAKKETKLIIHGFIDTPLSNWIKDMRRELLKHADWNVIVVDWAGGSLPLYTQATANTRLVGLEIAYLINYLIKNHSLNAKDVHMIGHSLGAHTAGYAGQRIPGLGRITGLDPAEPYFQGMPGHVRLDYTDANLVDIIHTDGSSVFLLGYGMSEPAGHVDFYPNNGKEQPGCDLTESPPLIPLTLIKEGIEEAGRVLVACSHIRAIKLFTESINSKCPYIAHKCTSYQSFMQGNCFSCKEHKDGCLLMGLHTSEYLKPPPSKYFIVTGKESPFCRRHYKVTVDFARPPKAETWVQGFMKMTLHSDNSIIRNIDLTPKGYEKLEHGTSRSFIITHGEDIGRVSRVEFYWEYDMDVLQPRSICFFWCNDHLYIASIHITETTAFDARAKRAIETHSKLCSIGLREYADIASKTSAVFIDDCDYDLI